MNLEVAVQAAAAFLNKTVESAHAYLFVGPIFNDYSLVGYSLLLKNEKAIIFQPKRVVIGHGPLQLVAVNNLKNLYIVPKQLASLCGCHCV